LRDAQPSPYSAGRSAENTSMEILIISLIAVACLGYLVVAVLRPEWF
jgi:K+-transporting ATPase KdpF subunit